MARARAKRQDSLLKIKRKSSDRRGIFRRRLKRNLRGKVEFKRRIRGIRRKGEKARRFF
jgi:hypothetical protein